MTQTSKTVGSPAIPNSNAVSLLGCVARAVDHKTSERGTSIARVTVAGVDEASGKTFYEPVVLYGRAADDARSLQPGQAVLADGFFQMRDNKDGYSELEIRYTSLRSALGLDEARRETDASGAVRLIGGFARAMLYGRVIGSKQPELRYTAQGTAVIDFSVNARVQFKENGSWESANNYVRVTSWGPLAEMLANLGVQKGLEAAVMGMPTRGKYGSSQTGKTVYTLGVTASSVTLAEGKGGAAPATGGGSIDAMPSFEDMGGGMDEDLPF